MISVIIPVHDEEVLIGSCLSRVLEGAEPGELEVIVVANDCTDATAERAKEHGDAVTVVETPIGGKPNALDLGDAQATAFPRVYLDVDVVIDVHAIRRLADVLAEGDVMLAAPRLRLDLSGSSRLARSYYRVWLRLPWASDEPVGSGVYALSEEGRARFERFHPDGADDWWVSKHVDRGARRCLDDVSFTVPASRSIRQVVRRKARILAAMRLVAPDLERAGRLDEPGLLASTRFVLRDRWTLLPDLLLFGVVSALARWRAARMLRRGRIEWAADARRPAEAPVERRPPEDGRPS